MNKLLHGQVFHPLQKLINLPNPNLIIKTFHNLFPFFWFELEDPNTAVNHGFGVVALEKRGGVDQAVDLVQVVVVVQLVVEVQERLEGGEGLDVGGVVRQAFADC